MANLMQNDKRPPTFQDGKDYFYWPKGEIYPTRVTFVAYDPCPAFIIVRYKDKRLRCSQEDLFTVEMEQH